MATLTPPPEGTGPTGPAGARGMDGPDQPGAAVLARATVAMQAQPEPDWTDVGDRVRDRLRRVSRPGRQVLVGSDAAGAVRVDELIVVDAVRRALRQVPGCRPVGIGVDLDPAGAAARLRVQVRARYGLDVRDVAARVRTAAAATVVDVLGTGCPVDVAVVDVDV